jgi:high-affinity Fe2+/Pb2+ permease
VLICIAAAVAMYLFTKDRRWLRWAWRVFAGAVAVALIVAAFLVLERLVIAI